ncbi:ferredoxin [Streptomyces nitrosporeus]|uniref:Ferredoxin n=1 Tax=Streptomyces nitrosporeus TaxID=28894 RepID=A0A5J6FED4_9ACTN|nr:ferredoxin [Streptomyces nitrosporeus]QEU74778.1 ferredoxin [Streptomyces nitrosporeus]GGY85731.1 ferredoxin [Streptomyces nitrosporeus]
MRVAVDMKLCESHGQCVFAAPQVFSFDDEEYLVYEPEPDDALRDRVEKAAAACPVRAITLGPAS